MTSTFLHAAEENGAAVHGPWDASELPGRAADIVIERVREHGAGVAVPTGDSRLDELGLPDRLRALGIAVLTPDDPACSTRIADVGVGVTAAVLGVARTGTFVMACGPGRPRGTHIVPPAHVCIVRAADLVGDLPDALARLAAELPSNLSWVGGPSRTADLEMRPTIGVHGPKTVDVIVVAADSLPTLTG